MSIPSPVSSLAECRTGPLAVSDTLTHVAAVLRACLALTRLLNMRSFTRTSWPNSSKKRWRPMCWPFCDETCRCRSHQAARYTSSSSPPGFHRTQAPGGKLNIACRSCGAPQFEPACTIVLKQGRKSSRHASSPTFILLRKIKLLGF